MNRIYLFIYFYFLRFKSQKTQASNSDNVCLVYFRLVSPGFWKTRHRESNPLCFKDVSVKRSRIKLAHDAHKNRGHFTVSDGLQEPTVWARQKSASALLLCIFISIRYITEMIARLSLYDMSFLTLVLIKESVAAIFDQGCTLALLLSSLTVLNACQDSASDPSGCAWCTIQRMARRDALL